MGVEDAFREGRQNTDGMKRKEKIENSRNRNKTYSMKKNEMSQFSVSDESK